MTRPKQAAHKRKFTEHAEENRRVMEKVAARILALTEGKAAVGNVVQLEVRGA